MGIEIDKEHFASEEYLRFGERLQESIEVLGGLLERPGFGEGASSLGAELEVSLVDRARRPLPMNQHVLRESLDPRLTVELDRFNLESNLQHGPLAGQPFSALASECQSAIGEMRRAAALHGGEIVMIGILPTLREDDLGARAMTESMRYRALSAGLLRLRQEPFLIDIHGEEQLRFQSREVTPEGAATSFQIHLRVPPTRFADLYNAVQLATPWVLAVSGNSPTFLGRLLWEETRVALFKQAVDHRAVRGREGGFARVSFGERWIEGPLELFAESVARHPPLLPVLDPEDPRRVQLAGGVPALRELRLHQGTVWRWNRAIYDPAEAGHLRIEMRALPSGPTALDMLASTAFHLGLAFELAESAAAWVREVPFDEVHRDFYRAAREGLSTKLMGPPGEGSERKPMHAWLEELLLRAQRGLDRSAVARADSAPLLARIDHRVRADRSGARWQLRALARLEATSNRQEALARMLSHYIERSNEGAAVDQWTEPAS